MGDMMKLIAGLLLVSLLLTACAQNDKTVIEVKGSDTMLQLVSTMAESYRQPGVSVSVTGGGSGTGIAALLNGEIDIADSSRPITQEELATAKARGIEVRGILIGRDMLSVIVHPENGVGTLTIEQVGRIYRGEVTNWNQVGGADMPITLYGRQSSSGTYVFFRDDVVKADYSPTMRNMEGNQAILAAVAQDRSGIGYVGVGYLRDEQGRAIAGVNAIDLSDGTTRYSPLDATTAESYPLVRPLYQYVGPIPPGSELEAFLRYELSEEGQALVEGSGFESITAKEREKNEKTLGTT